MYYQDLLPENSKLFDGLLIFHPRQRIEGAKENTREQRGHIAPKRGAAADERTRVHRPSLHPAKPN